MYKRYIIFAYNSYTEHGGLDDIYDSFNTIEEVKESLKEMYQPRTKIIRRKQIHNLQKSTSVEKHTYTSGFDSLEVLDCETRQRVLTDWKPQNLTKIEVLETIPGWVD